MSNIYKILTDVLHSGNFDLGEKLESIQYYQVHGEITLEQMEELTALAREKAQPQYDPENDISQLLDRLRDLEERVEKLEDTEVVEKYPEYEDDRWYFSGEGVTFEGTKYTCVAKKTKFSPGEKPKDWQEVTE
mgnify:CR=1 FL=1